MNSTIIYYSSCQEDPKFEQKIIDNLVKNSCGLPIISVSRKPIKLGKNICVGEKPVCYSNSFKQLLIGLREAKTKYCIAAEADTLYPPEYFQFTPPTDHVYRYHNLYVYFDGYNGFWKKRYVEAAQMCETKAWIKSLESIVKDWEPIKVNPPFVFTTKDKYIWSGVNPVLTMKTRKGIGFKTGFEKGSCSEIPYWGTVDDIKLLRRLL